MVFSLNCLRPLAARRALLFLLRAVYVVVSILLLRRSVAGVKGRWFVSVWGLASPQPTTERKEISLRAARDGGVVRESSQISPNQSFPPSRAARRFGLRFAFSNARPPLPPPRRGIVRNSSTSWLNHRCLGGAGRAGSSAFLATPNSRPFQRGGGSLGFASPYPTRGWDFPPRPRGPSCENSPRLGKISRWPARAALIRPRSFASHILRTIQRGGGDAVGLRSTLAAAFGGALRAVHIPKTERGAFRLSKLAEKLHPCQSIASRLAIARGIFARFSASGGRRPLNWDIAPAGRGGRLPA